MTIDGDVVRKRYLRAGRREQEREWEVLELLDRYAPGTGPRPISQEPGLVVMSRVPGEHIGDALDEKQTAAVVAAYRNLFGTPLPAHVEDRF